MGIITRKIAELLGNINTNTTKLPSDKLDVSFQNITDTGTQGTKIASGTTDQRGSTAGQIRFNTTTGLAEYYTGTDFKVIDSPPTVTAVSPTETNLSDSSLNITFTITGSNFQSGAVTKFIGNDATEITASTTTVTNSSTISAVIARSSFVNAKEPYDVRVTNVSGLSGTLDDQISVDTNPSWSTSSGQIGGSIEEGDSVNTSATATDADGDTIVYSVQSGTLPTGLSLNSSTGAITGTAGNVNGDTTSSFTLRATANSKTADRAFNIVIKELVLNGSTSAKAARSCKKIYDLGGAYQGSEANGLYWINNYGTIAAEQHYCLMDSSYSGGGWTLLYAGSSATTDWAGSNYQFNLNNSATPSPTTLYARNRSGTFTPTTSDKFMLRRADNNDYKVHTIGTWVAGSTWQNLSSHYNLGTGGSTVDASGNSMAGFACFECCAGAGGCLNGSGGDLCGFGKCTSNGCYNDGGSNECFGGAWATSGAGVATLSWGNGNNIEGTYASYWFRRDSASE